jgi:hypothetical protein
MRTEKVNRRSARSARLGGEYFVPTLDEDSLYQSAVKPAWVRGGKTRQCILSLIFLLSEKLEKFYEPWAPLWCKGTHGFGMWIGLFEVVGIEFHGHVLDAFSSMKTEK